MLTYEVNINIRRIIYCRHGELHQKGGPAYIYKNCDIAWFEYDKLHRKNGAAEMWANGNRAYWKRGKPCSKMK